MYAAGDTGLEIAPGKDVDENPDLREIGNIWNAVPTAKHWTPIDPIEGCITVNIGDGLQWWTDGLFKSTYHRVRAPKDGDNKVSASWSNTCFTGVHCDGSDLWQKDLCQTACKEHLAQVQRALVLMTRHSVKCMAVHCSAFSDSSASRPILCTARHDFPVVSLSHQL